MKPPILLPRFVWTGPVINLGNDSCNNIFSFKNIWVCVNEALNTGFLDFSITSHCCMEEIQRSFALMSRLGRKAKQGQQARRTDWSDGSRCTYWLLHCDETLKSSSHLAKPHLTVGFLQLCFTLQEAFFVFPQNKLVLFAICCGKRVSPDLHCRAPNKILQTMARWMSSVLFRKETCYTVVSCIYEP